MKIIIAPHPDDEIIGCWTLLRENKIDKVVFVNFDITEERRAEAQKSAHEFNFEPLYLHKPTNLREQLFGFLIGAKEVFVPHPYDHHPHHRAVTQAVQSLVRSMKFDIYYYSIEMNIPEIRYLPNYEQKKEVLNKIYPSQARLWNNNAKYYLFEGITKYPSTPYISVVIPFVRKHRWLKAPATVMHLRQLHQHVFTVIVDVGVRNLDREIEFSIFRDQLLRQIDADWNDDWRDLSCEMIAEKIYYITKEILSKAYNASNFVPVRVRVCETPYDCAVYGDRL